MNLAEMRAALAKKAQRLKALVGQDAVTDEEKTEKRTLLTECQGLKTDIEAAEVEERFLADLDTSFVQPPAGGKPDAGRQPNTVESEPPVYRNLAAQLKDVVSLGKNPNSVEGRTAGERLVKAEQRMYADGNLLPEKRAAGDGQTVGVPNEGGTFVQSDFALDLVTKGFNNSAIYPKTQKRVLSSGANSMTIYGIDEDSRVSGSRNGGVAVYTQAELEAYTASKAKFAKIELKINKLTGLLHLSDEIMEDAAFLAGEVSDLFQLEFAFKVQNLMYGGKGAGEFLGAMNAPCLVTVAKDTSQTAKTITATNISNMKSRVSGNAEFVGNKDIIPQLDTLYKGTGAAATALFKQTSATTGVLDGIPITFIEQCETLGTTGDLLLGDWGQYITATKGAIKKAESIHLKFEYGQKTIRWTLRMDGQPRWKSALTPFKGSMTTSPFVALATRG